jgi:hypothetical protein
VALPGGTSIHTWRMELTQEFHRLVRLATAAINPTQEVPLSESRFSAVSRRAFLQGMSAAALLGVVGCASDSDVLPSANQTTSDSDETTSPTSTGAAAAGLATIAFTYTADATSSGAGPGGGVRNPYIAVWIEDASGTLVKTVSLWHLQNGQDRWLSELYKWYAVAGGVDTNSSATRTAGSYTVGWDLTDTDGTAVPNGDYTVWVEAIREHGPYSLTSGSFTLDGSAMKATIDDNSELSAIQISYQP